MSEYEFSGYGFQDENKKSIEELKAQDYTSNYNQQYLQYKQESAARQMYTNPNPTAGTAYGAQSSYHSGGALSAPGMPSRQQIPVQSGAYSRPSAGYGARQGYTQPAPAKKKGRAALALIMALVCVLAGLGGTLLGGMIVEDKYADSIRGYEQLVSQLQTQNVADKDEGNDLPPDDDGIIPPDDGDNDNTTGNKGDIVEPDSTVDSDGRQGLSIKEIARLVGPSVVSIYADIDSGGFYQGRSAGSGIIITEDGTIVTNHHVIEGATNIEIVLSDGTEYQARVLASDANEDVAVLKADATGLTAATLGNSSDLEVGDTAVVIGNPLGELEGTVTAGIISALEREVRLEDGTIKNLMQTDAAINSGNSGGALINAYGEIIGIVNAKNEGLGVEGLAFAIPIDRAKGIITDLMDKGYVTGRPQLGVTIYRPSPTSLPGAVVADLISGGAAEKAGVQVEDRIISLGGEEVTDFETLELAKNKHRPGDTLEMIVVRNGEELTLSVTLGEWIQ